MGRPVFYICPLRTLRLAINCLAVRGVRPGLRISPPREVPSREGPFFHSVEAVNSPQPRLPPAKTLCAPRGGGALPRPWEMWHRLRLAMNCFAVRGVRPGLRISPHGGSSP